MFIYVSGFLFVLFPQEWKEKLLVCETQYKNLIN